MDKPRGIAEYKKHAHRSVSGLKATIGAQEHSNERKETEWTSGGDQKSPKRNEKKKIHELTIHREDGYHVPNPSKYHLPLVQLPLCGGPRNATRLERPIAKPTGGQQ